MNKNETNDNSQSRKWNLTINNPKDYGLTRDAILAILYSLSIIYFCIVDEIGNKTGTPHTHIFIVSEAPIRFSTLKNKFPQAHIEKAYGSAQQNRDYLQKTGKWADTDKSDTTVEGSFEEHGTMPIENEKEKKSELKVQALKLIDEGYDTNQVLDVLPELAFKVKDLEILCNIRREREQPVYRDIKVIYLYGETGTGKTRSLFEAYDAKDICRVTNYNTTGCFDDYHGQSVLVFEEYHSQIPLPQMLTYLDVYPVSLPSRYHNKPAIYTTVYIISNIPLMEQYKKEQYSDTTTWRAFLRRISAVYRQNTDGTRTQIDKKGVDFYEENPFVG